MDLAFTSSLLVWYSRLWSYNPDNAPTSFLELPSVFGGTFDQELNVTYRALEVFTIQQDSSNSVPEPLTLALVGIGLAGIAAARRRT